MRQIVPSTNYSARPVGEEDMHQQGIYPSYQYTKAKEGEVQQGIAPKYHSVKTGEEDVQKVQPASSLTTPTTAVQEEDEIKPVTDETSEYKPKDPMPFSQAQESEKKVRNRSHKSVADADKLARVNQRPRRQMQTRHRLSGAMVSVSRRRRTRRRSQRSRRRVGSECPRFTRTQDLIRRRPRFPRHLSELMDSLDNAKELSWVAALLRGWIGLSFSCSNCAGGPTRKSLCAT